MGIKKKSKYNINKELSKAAKKIPYNTFVIKAARVYYFIASKLKKMPNDLNIEKFTIKGYNNLPFSLELIEPKPTQSTDSNATLPAMLYIHGGAFSYPASPHHKKLAYRYAKEIPCRVILPDYHLSPRYKYPTAFFDNLTAYKWLTDNALQLKIDENRIIVAGDSAGAALAASVVNSYKKEQLIPPYGQLLIYPVTDASMSSKSMKEYIDTPIWNTVNNQKMWRYYLNGASEQERKKASPINDDLPNKLPKTYIETAEYDCLHDEGVAYANKLKSAGASVILNETKGTFHGYDLCLSTEINRTNVKRRIEFIKGLIRGE